MYFLNERDRRQLKANLWRSKTALSRNKGKIRAYFISPVIFFAILLFMNFTIFVSQVETVEPYGNNTITVTNSETPATSSWSQDPTL